MNKALIQWLVAIILAVTCSVGNAKEFSAKPNEKLVGKWDNHAGIISLFIKEVDGKKQARMLVVSEHIESRYSKLSIDLQPDELDELEELVELTLKQMGNPDDLPIPPLGTREVSTAIGTMIYPDSKLTLYIIDPAGTKRYVSMVFKTLNDTLDKTNQYVFWLEWEDLVSLEKLLDKTLLRLE